MEAKNYKKTNSNVISVGECLETPLYMSLTRVLGNANEQNAISFNRKFRQIFMNRLAEDLWYNNPLHPERQNTSVCNMPFVVGDGNELPTLPHTFWGMTRQEAAIVIQVFQTLGIDIFVQSIYKS
ncbi:Hypothetical protein CINCED_3A002481 [Cinara cedri]|uniref:Uncharacterized protein n=1 Tax=Cinara cedri TaxID=506608 RepID=A0A5E4NQF9_9HEMI|nr:Hypothetical protein CINCED_3A002481 [Cinara cedri]